MQNHQTRLTRCGLGLLLAMQVFCDRPPPLLSYYRVPGKSGGIDSLIPPSFGTLESLNERFRIDNAEIGRGSTPVLAID